MPPSATTGRPFHLFASRGRSVRGLESVCKRGGAAAGGAGHSALPESAQAPRGFLSAFYLSLDLAPPPTPLPLSPGQLAVLWGCVLAAGGAVQRVLLTSKYTAIVDTIPMASIVPALSLKAQG